MTLVSREKQLGVAVAAVLLDGVQHTFATNVVLVDAAVSRLSTASHVLGLQNLSDRLLCRCVYLPSMQVPSAPFEPEQNTPSPTQQL